LKLKPMDLEKAVITIIDRWAGTSLASIARRPVRWSKPCRG
jgi:hypothetical protein